MKKLLTGVQPTGRVHIGNYFGAMKQIIDNQAKYDTQVMLANYHAVTSVSDGAVLRQNTLDLALDFLALGFDVEKGILFRQADIAEHTELAWIFECLTTVPYLQRAHAYKDAVAKDKEVNAGVFNYPLLMAADILLYDADVVPVGLDQQQHLEIARDTAEKFNRVYGDTFKLPEALILDDVKTIVGSDGRKMSKSYGNTLPLFASDEEVRKFVMGIKTDSKGVTEPKDPETCLVFALHRFFSLDQLPDLDQRYRSGGISYHESKEILTVNVINFIAPLHEKRQQLATDTNTVLKILATGAARAREQAFKKMSKVREVVGL
jgi:tryptophanyl-tRNA synthetase